MLRLSPEVQMQIANRVLNTPAPVLEVLLAPRRKRYRSARLDPTAHVMLGLYKRSGRRPIHEMEPARARKALAQMATPFEVEKVPCHTEDTTLGGVPVRVYRGGAPDAPAMLFFHGGGFVVGSVESYDRVCRYIATKAEATVVSVEYRLAPEHMFPAGHDDARRAFDGAMAGELSGVTPSRWMVAGDSAGGNLAAVVAQYAKDIGVELSFQYLVYPTTDLRHGTESYKDLAPLELLLTNDLLEWFGRHFTDNAATLSDPVASPNCREDVSGLCPAKVITAGFDPLWDEAEIYAGKLRAAGNAIEHRHFPTMFHGFMSFASLFSEGRDVLHDMARALHGLK